METAGEDEEYDFDKDFDVSDPLYSQFQEILSRFNSNDGDSSKNNKANGVDKPEIYYEDDNDAVPDEEDNPDDGDAPKMSKKKRKQMNKLSVAELKSIVRRPELVEWTDVSSSDPRLLVSIKASRNVIPVPTHWSLKREYLSSKRGVEKPHFSLPKFIAETGISDMRDAALEKESEKTQKQKQRDRVQPKMGKLDIDYQRLYEAFFKHQVKPPLTRFGEVYYEGKEHETNLRHLRPGELSDDLREALGMPPGAPPPWLINMQRFGPPPSYPALKIPGLNAPPPPGAQWGFHPGGYGKPPVDEFNRPLFGGDVFGTLEDTIAPNKYENVGVDKNLWGELQAVEEDEEEEEVEEEDEDVEEEEEDDGTHGEEHAVNRRDREGPDFDKTGLASTVPTEIGGMESIGGEFLLRKGAAKKSGTDSEEPSGARQAYQVLEEKNIRSQGFFGGERAYDLSKSNPIPLLEKNVDGRKRKAQGDVEVSVNVDDLVSQGNVSKKDLEKRYNDARKEESGWGGGSGLKVDQDDLSEMIAEESRKRLKKDQEDRERKKQGGNNNTRR